MYVVRLGAIWALCLVLILQSAKAEQPVTETHEFQADVHRLMDVMVNSLYPEPEIFLRELVSNSADSLTKLNNLELVNSTLRSLIGEEELRINVVVNESEGTITVEDNGIGMDRSELVSNLGTIAKSGTAAFVDSLSKSKGAEIGEIGKFGVGFYSVYLVASAVEVTSKTMEDDFEHVWVSKTERVFEVRSNPTTNRLAHGTSVKLFLKPSAEEFLDSSRIKDLVKKHSEFVHYHIYLKEISDEADDNSGILINESPAMWVKSSSELGDDDYLTFYRHLTSATSDEPPLAWVHFSTEGEYSFHTLLYIPYVAPFDVSHNFTEGVSKIKLYVRRVLVMQSMDCLPQFLNFIVGLVDSDDLPLTVSREQLQKKRVTEVIRSKVTSKVMETLQRLSKEDYEIRRNMTENRTIDRYSIGTSPFSLIWGAYHLPLKVGIMHEPKLRPSIIHLYRFRTTQLRHASFQEYVDRMPAFQKEIYYVSGSDAGLLRKSPMVIRAIKNKVEVILLDQAFDDQCFRNLGSFGQYPINLLSSTVTFGDKDEQNFEKLNLFYNCTYAPLMKYLTAQFGHRVTSVNVSFTIEAPALMVSKFPEMNPSFERTLKSRVAEVSAEMELKSHRVLLVNPQNQLIKTMYRQFLSYGFMDALMLQVFGNLIDTACILSGYDLDDGVAFANRLNRGMMNIVSKTFYVPPYHPEFDGVEMDDMLSFAQDVSDSNDKYDHDSESASDRYPPVDDSPSPEMNDENDY